MTGSSESLWILLAFVPSSLMLGVTTHISTDLAPMPLLWVLPLAIYLGTFILAFATRQIVPDKLIVRVLPVLVLIAMASVAMRINAPKLIPIHLAAFFCCAMICHTRLARTRPSTEHLTEFYLWMSLGGMLGGAFNTLVATYVFNGIYEYPLVLALACVLRPSPVYGTAQPESWLKIIVGGVVPVALCVRAVGARPGRRRREAVHAAVRRGRRAHRRLEPRDPDGAVQRARRARWRCRSWSA